MDIHIDQACKYLKIGSVVETMGDVWQIESLDETEKRIHLRSIRTKNTGSFLIKDITGMLLPICHEKHELPTPVKAGPVKNEVAAGPAAKLTGTSEVTPVAPPKTPGPAAPTPKK